MADAVRIEFWGLPPFKANPGPTRAGAQRRQAAFRVAAEEVIASLQPAAPAGSYSFPWNPMRAAISLKIHYRRVNGTNDSANIVGGVCDALQGVCYSDDRQVSSITYTEAKEPELEDDCLVATVLAIVDQPAVAPPGWEEQVDIAWATRAADRDGVIPGPQAAMDAAKILNASKLSDSEYKNLDGLLAASEGLASRWARRENTILLQGGDRRGTETRQ